MIDGVPTSSAYKQLSQLEIGKLLQCGDQVIYPKGLNWGLEPTSFSPPEPPVCDMDIFSEPVCKPLLFQVDLSSVMLGGWVLIALAPHRASTPSSSLHSAKECPSETVTHTSMAAELQELLSRAVLNTSSLNPGHTTPRKSTSMARGAPPSIGSRRPAWPGEGRTGHTKANGYPLTGITVSGHTQWYHPNQPFTLSDPHIGNSWSSKCPHSPTMQDSSWRLTQVPS